MSTDVPIVVTCEHARNRVPRGYKALFRNRRGLLQTHRGFDPGARELAQRFARAVGAASFFGEYTRLLVELNRSSHNPRVFSPITRQLSRDEKRIILEQYYFPYRRAVEERILETLRVRGDVIHLSVHTFAPILRGDVRRADVGLLYDARRKHESQFCRRWQQALRANDSALHVRRNYPYRGSSDGMTASLRHTFKTPQYLGIELEVNQKFPLGERPRWLCLERILIDTFQQAASAR